MKTSAFQFIRSSVFLSLLAPALTLGQVTITGMTRQITATANDQFDPAISGNIVVYNEVVPSATDIAYVDLTTTGMATNITNSTNADEQMADVCGNTIVYTRTDHASGDADVMAFVVGGGTSAVAEVAGSSQSNPGISGNIVAWEDTRDNGTREIYAKDLASGIFKRLTDTAVAAERDPAVSGTKVAYASIDSSGCQILVTDFATTATTAVTTTPGCHRLPDISGNTVVYQGDRDGNQDIFVYDLTTGTEMRLMLAGTQRNPNVSGDWVAYEDVLSGPSGSSDIKLYHIPSGTHHTAVATASNEFLNDIDGQRVAYTGDAAGNLDIYVFEFTVMGQITVAIDIKPNSFPNSINLGSGGTVPVAILSSATFDATSVDPMTVTLSGASVGLKGKGTPMAAVQDVNGDGPLDLVVHVSTEALQLSDTDTEAVLEGQTFDGTPIKGMDSVRIVP